MPKALGHLVTEHWRFVYTMCLSHVGHTADAEDLTQEVFMQVAHDLVHLREPDKFLPWLRQVARNVCRMWRRRQRPTPEPLDTVAELDDPTAAARRRGLGTGGAIALQSFISCSGTCAVELQAIKAPYTPKSALCAIIGMIDPVVA